MASRRSSRLSAIPPVEQSPTLVNGTSKEATAGAAAASKKRKAPPSDQAPKPKKPTKIGKTENSSNDGFAIPATPNRKKPTAPPPPSTPTPSAAKALGQPAHAPSIANNPRRKAALLRAASPHHTNAPLLSPATSKILTPSLTPALTPQKSALTTGNILEKALKHLIAVEPKLKPIIEANPCSVFSPESLAEEIDPFENLSSAIISQQVSGAAARSIKAKFVGLFDLPTGEGPVEKQGHFPKPAQVAEKSIETLRTAGLSQRKAEYIQGLAEKFGSGELSTQLLMNAEYEEVFEKLIAVRGLGAWSVEMFACFGLKRMDVFSTGDLGVQRGLASLMGRDVGKLKAKGGGKWKYMSEKDMLEISEKFAPYRSVFMWYCWRVPDAGTDVSTLQA